jgi:hypothetical protein
MKTFKIFGIIGILCGLLLVFCGISCRNSGDNLYVAAVKNNTDSSISAGYQYFDGPETREIVVKAGQTLIFSYSSAVESGTLSIKVIDGVDKTAAEFETGGDGKDTLSVDKSGTYKLVITGDGTKGNYKVSWEIK